MKKLQILCAGFILVVLSSSQLMASAVYNTKINRLTCANNRPVCVIEFTGGTLYLDKNGYYNLSGGPNNCQRGGTAREIYYYSFDSSTSEGKNILSMAMAAKISSWGVSVIGTGSCNPDDAFVGINQGTYSEFLNLLQISPL